MSTVNVLAVTRGWRDLLLFAGNADDLEATHEGAQELRQRSAKLGEPSGTDLRGATVWMTAPPEWDSTGLTDLSEFAIRPLDETEQGALKAAAERIVDRDARARAQEKIAPLVAKGDKWTGSADQLRWQSWLGASPPPPADTYRYSLTSYLTKLMCSARWSNGSIRSASASSTGGPD